ncbi:MAG: NUDIX domain-containing protein [Alphaproteobacteria bacterium]|nr:NUDIX domain-containing protein [Alphaproteobacteria bacterium]
MWHSLFLRILLLWRAFLAPVAFGVSALVSDQAGRVLLVRHGYRAGWHFPGGGVDGGELPGAAILRELKEEVGLERSGPPELIGLFSRRVGFVRNLIALYRVRDVAFTFKPGLEIREAQFFETDNLPDSTSPAVRRRIAEFVSGQPPGEEW